MGLSNVQNIMVGLILFLIVIGSGVYMVGSFVSIHDSSLDPNGVIQRFNTTLYQANAMTNTVNSMQSNLVNTTADKTGILGWLNSLISTVFAGVTTLFTSLGFIAVALPIISQMLGIPTFIGGLLFMILIIIIVYAIWQAVMRVL